MVIFALMFGGVVTGIAFSLFGCYIFCGGKQYDKKDNDE